MISVFGDIGAGPQRGFELLNWMARLDAVRFTENGDALDVKNFQCSCICAGNK